MIGEKSWVGFLLEKFLRQIKRDQSYFVPTLAAVRTEWKVRQKLGGQEGPRGSEHPKGPDSKRQTFWNLVWKIRIWKVQKVRHVHKVRKFWRFSISGRSERSARSGRYTANVYIQTTDKPMFISVISTVRWIRKLDIVKCKINKQNILIFNLRFVFYPQNVLSKMKSHIKVKITVVCL